MSADDLLRLAENALQSIAKRKTAGPFKPGQLRAEHRAMISEARDVLETIKATKP